MSAVTFIPGRTRMQPVDDDLVAGLEARAHDAEAVDQAAELDRPVLQAVALAEHQHELAVLVGADGRVAHQQRAVRSGCPPA